jgi:hypothetical protein
VVAGEALLTVARAKREAGIGQHPIGSYRGLDLCVERNNMSEINLKLVGRMGYTTPIGDSAIGCITRIENLAERLPGLLSKAETTLAETKHQLDNAMQAVTKPFEYEEKLAAQLTRQSEINTALEFKELSKQQGEFLSDPSAGESAEDEIETEEEYEDEIEAA